MSNFTKDDIKILFQDEYIVIAEKPSGLLTHPSRECNDKITCGQFHPRPSADPASGVYLSLWRDRPKVEGGKYPQDAMSVHLIPKAPQLPCFLQQESLNDKFSSVYNRNWPSNALQP